MFLYLPHSYRRSSFRKIPDADLDPYLKSQLLLKTNKQINKMLHFQLESAWLQLLATHQSTAEGISVCWIQQRDAGHWPGPTWVELESSGLEEQSHSSHSPCSPDPTGSLPMCHRHSGEWKPPTEELHLSFAEGLLAPPHVDVPSGRHCFTRVDLRAELRFSFWSYFSFWKSFLNFPQQWFFQ